MINNNSRVQVGDRAEEEEGMIRIMNKVVIVDVVEVVLGVVIGVDFVIEEDSVEVIVIEEDFEVVVGAEVIEVGIVILEEIVIIIIIIIMIRVIIIGVYLIKIIIIIIIQKEQAGIVHPLM